MEPTCSFVDADNTSVKTQKTIIWTVTGMNTQTLIWHGLFNPSVMLGFKFRNCSWRVFRFKLPCNRHCQAQRVVSGGLTKPYPPHMLLKTKQNDFGLYSGKEAKDRCHAQFAITMLENVWKTWDMMVSALTEMTVCNTYQFSFIVMIIRCTILSFKSDDSVNDIWHWVTG